MNSRFLLENGVSDEALLNINYLESGFEVELGGRIDPSTGHQYGVVEHADLALLAELGASLSIVVEDGQFDLLFLEPVLGKFKNRLSVSGEPAQFENADVVQLATQVRKIEIPGNYPAKLELANQTALRDVNVYGPSTLSAVSNPWLEDLRIYLPCIPHNLDVRARLVTLDLNSARMVERVPAVADCSRLVHLSIGGFREVDLRAFAGAKSLATLGIEKTDCLTGMQVITSFTDLRWLDIISVKRVDDPFILLESEIDLVRINNNYAFGPEFMARAMDRPRWEIEKYRGSESAANTFPFKVVDREVIFQSFAWLQDELDQPPASEPDRDYVENLISLALSAPPNERHLGSWSFDSGGDQVIVRFADPQSADLAAKILAAAFNSGSDHPRRR